MKHKIQLWGAVLLAGTLVVTACGGDSPSPSSEGSSPTGKPRRGGELVVGRSSPIDGLAGDQCFGDGSLVLNPIVFDSLLRIAPDGQGVVGGLAEGVDYDEAALTYTWNIRAGVKFSDGSDLTAEDVGFSFEQWMAGTTFGSYYSMIESIEVVDELTVVTHLNRPDTFLPNLVTWCSATVYPTDFGGRTSEEYFKAPVSAGAFVVESWTNPGPSETIRLTRNEHFWQPGKPYLDAITIKVSADPGQRALAFESGELDIVEGLDAVGAGDLDEENVLFLDPTAVAGILLNSARPELADVRVRQAISLAIDREAIVAALDGLGEPAVGMLPINTPGSAPGAEPYTYDSKRARQLLEEARVDDLSLELSYDGGSGNATVVASVLQAQLKEVGITLSLVPSDSATVVGQVFSGDYAIAMAGVTVISPTIFDPVSYIASALYPSSGADTSVIAEQFEIGISTTDEEVQREAVVAIENDAAQQGNLLGIYYFRPAYAVSSDVQGFSPTVYRIWYAEDISKR